MWSETKGSAIGLIVDALNVHTDNVEVCKNGCSALKRITVGDGQTQQQQFNTITSQHHNNTFIACLL